MPRIKRWFPVSQDINSDPETWELSEEFGDRALRVWLEMLSIADRNDGLIGHDSPQLHAIFAAKCRVYSPKVRSIFVWCLGKGWLEDRDGFRIAKYRKYHRTPEHKPLPSEPNLSEPILTKPNKNKKAQAPLFVRPEWIPKTEWDSFVEFRKRIRKPLTARAMELAVKSLAGLRDQGCDVGAVIDQSVMNGWRSFYPTKPVLVPQHESQLSERTQRMLRRGL